jgi:hypothetical protein
MEEPRSDTQYGSRRIWTLPGSHSQESDEANSLKVNNNTSDAFRPERPRN